MVFGTGEIMKMQLPYSVCYFRTPPISGILRFLSAGIIHKSSLKENPLWKQGAANDSLLYKTFTI
jgi:hypothetical protein